MRISVLGSLSIVFVTSASTAWSAPDDPEKPAPAKPDAAPDAPPSPKPLTGPIAGPLPPDDAELPPLPASPPEIDDAPPPPPPSKPARRSEWGAQFRLEAAPMRDDASSNAGMGGIGFALRPRPSPHFAIDFGLDFLGGRDFNGDRRSETALTVNPVLFLNPRNKVQIYLFAGLGIGSARVERSNIGGLVRHYTYVGADAGVGLEFRFWKRFAVSGDVLAFVRDRSDVGSSAPEYLDAATRRFTDSSAGALLRLGGTYYW